MRVGKEDGLLGMEGRGGQSGKYRQEFASSPFPQLARAVSSPGVLKGELLFTAQNMGRVLPSLTVGGDKS